ncbi:MAG: trypsin-like peptidase domain-containing protein [Nitrospinota bacterium]|nr:trypsin-like peptidase domain-containing protein [Nitrospinota bacterium]
MFDKNQSFGLKISSWALMLLVLAFINSKQHFSYTPPSPIKSISNKSEIRNDYNGLLKLQEAFIRNAKSLKPSVVSINKVKEVVEESFWLDIYQNKSMPLYLKIKTWFSNKLWSRKYLVESVGSGIVLDSDGYILTNYHVIKGLERVLVKLSDGHEYFGKTLGYDSFTDLAVLKISTLRSLPEPRFGESSNLEVGEWVMAIGNPYALEGTVTVGIVSGKGRTDLGITRFESFIQTDASINPGNSGGPLINLDGNIIGVNTGVAAIGSGVGFAIPIETALIIANQLVESGSINRGWLGVGIQDLTPELASSLQFENTDGVLVNSVAIKTPARKGGIEQGDIILKYDGKSVFDLKKLQKMVAETSIGKIVEIKIFREGKEKYLKIKIGKLIS